MDFTGFLALVAAVFVVVWLVALILMPITLWGVKDEARKIRLMLEKHLKEAQS